jgi:hypothetical protein
VTVGLAIVARDEADNLPGLLDSVQGAFDQVVLCDTGSAAGETERSFSATDGDRRPFTVR